MVLHVAAGAVASGETELTSYGDACNSPHSAERLHAMQIEYDAFISNGTWKLITLPAGHKVLPCKWVYMLNCALNGSIKRYKARLVVGGALTVRRDRVLR